MCSWHKYKHKVNLPLPVLIQMEMEGIKKGANPNEWHAFFCNIPLSRCISCEKWDGNKWVEHIKNLGEYCISKSN